MHFIALAINFEQVIILRFFGVQHLVTTTESVTHTSLMLDKFIKSQALSAKIP